MQENPLKFFFSKIQNARQITIDIHYLASVVCVMNLETISRYEEDGCPDVINETGEVCV